MLDNSKRTHVICMFVFSLEGTIQEQLSFRPKVSFRILILPIGENVQLYKFMSLHARSFQANFGKTIDQKVSESLHCREICMQDKNWLASKLKKDKLGFIYFAKGFCLN